MIIWFQVILSNIQNPITPSVINLTVIFVFNIVFISTSIVIDTFFLFFIPFKSVFSWAVTV